MGLGEKLLNARQELGLSQKQVCGEKITRNMLSQLEHGSASPSMETLQYLAARLQKPVSFFLDEEGTVSVNQNVMFHARALYEQGQYQQALEALDAYRAPDPVYDMEWAFLQHSCRLSLAEAAIGRSKEILAQNLLAEAESFEDSLWLFPELRHRRARLLGRLKGQNLDRVCRALPNLDEDLLLRARAQLEGGSPLRAGQLLDAMEARDELWHYHRGRAYFAQGQYRSAISCFERCESMEPRAVYSLLEQCWRCLKDFEQAYFYACKQRG